MDMEKKTALKTALFVLFVPGLLLGALPVWLMSSDAALFSFGVFRWLAAPFWLAGAAGMLWCAADFARKGRGTPAPIDPPKELVVSGLYRFVRNPMYVSGMLALFGHALWFPSAAIAAMPLIFFTACHLFVTFYEEPHLRKTFGAAYARYCQSVPRWLPRFAFRRE
jgi:protein-S-isoprenylcysteine O-methyltransferase Ste14